MFETQYSMVHDPLHKSAPVSTMLRTLLAVMLLPPLLATLSHTDELGVHSW